MKVEIASPEYKIPLPNIYAQVNTSRKSLSLSENLVTRSKAVNISLPNWYTESGFADISRMFNYSFGTRGNNIDMSFVDATKNYIFGYGKKNYGFQIDHSSVGRFTAYEIRTRNASVMTSYDALERAIGGRVSIGNFGVSVRHNFNSLVNPTHPQLGSELYFNYKSFNAWFGVDILSTRYYTSLGVLGFNIVASKAFNAYGSTLQISWGKGWEIFLEHDDGETYIDGVSGIKGTAVGVGRPTRNYFSFGTGVDAENNPQYAANLQLPSGAVTLGWLEKNKLKIGQLSANLGPYSFVWENTIVPDSVVVPVLKANNFE